MYYQDDKTVSITLKRVTNITKFVSFCKEHGHRDRPETLKSSYWMEYAKSLPKTFEPGNFWGETFAYGDRVKDFAEVEINTKKVWCLEGSGQEVPDNDPRMLEYFKAKKWYESLDKEHQRYVDLLAPVVIG